MMSGLQHLRHRRHEVIVFHLVDPAERDFPFERASRFQDMEGGGRLSAIRKACGRSIWSVSGVSRPAGGRMPPQSDRPSSGFDRRALRTLPWRISGKEGALSDDRPVPEFVALAVPSGRRRPACSASPESSPAAGRRTFDVSLSFRHLRAATASTALLEYSAVGPSVLFLLLLVFAIMRPNLSGRTSLFGLGGGRSVSLIVDGSASMNAQTAGVSSLERAKEAANAVLDNLSTFDRVTLIRSRQST